MDNPELRCDLRDTFEHHVESGGQYIGDFYNLLSEKFAMRRMEPILKKYGL